MQMKFYSPLTADFYPDEPDYENERCPMDGHDLLEYEAAVRKAVQDDIRDFQGNLMKYYGRRDSVRSKVVSAIPGVEKVNGELVGSICVELKDSLTGEEQTTLCSYISGQYSDGWGEGFEDRGIDVGDGTLYVHFWQSHDFEIYPATMEPPTIMHHPQRPQMQLIGQDGNIFAIMGRAARLLNACGQGDKAKEMRGRVMSCDSYHKALGIISEYVETELSCGTPAKGPAKHDRGDAR